MSTHIPSSLTEIVTRTGFLGPKIGNMRLDVDGQKQSFHHDVIQSQTEDQALTKNKTGRSAQYNGTRVAKIGSSRQFLSGLSCKYDGQGF